MHSQNYKLLDKSTSNFFQAHYAWSVDFGIAFFDKRPLFGVSKTWRGVFSSIVVTALLAKLLGFDYVIGLQVSSLAMTGDLVSSFIKRRLDQEPGSRALFMDQVPESLLPAGLLMKEFGLNLIQVIVLVFVFIIIEQALSFAFYKLGVRKHPY